MDLDEKMARSRGVISRVLAEFRRPAVMWSSGKDSMVLLFLLRAARVFCPVIFHRTPFFGHKYEFADRMIREWELQVYDWPPSGVALTKANGQLSIMNFYRMGAGTCQLPQDLYELPALEGRDRRTWLCGLQDLVHRPIGDVRYPWDVVFHGHKNSDVDPLFGAVPLECDVQMNPNVGGAPGPALAFVLREWTDADVWEYTRRFEVPQQSDRYNVETGEENPDRTTNPDYLEGCTRCLDRDGPKKVFCPRLKCEVGNVSHQVPYQDPVRPSYMQCAEVKEEHAV